MPITFAHNERGSIMLFASGDYDGIFMLIWGFIIFLGIGKTCQMLKKNDAVRGAAKKGALSVLGRIFFK
jgi:hypothetical protein